MRHCDCLVWELRDQIRRWMAWGEGANKGDPASLLKRLSHALFVWLIRARHGKLLYLPHWIDARRSVQPRL